MTNHKSSQSVSLSGGLGTENEIEQKLNVKLSAYYKTKNVKAVII
jgi:hypothetical protein